MKQYTSNTKTGGKSLFANPKQRGDYFLTDSISRFERSRAQNMVSAWGFGSRVNQGGVRHVYVGSYIK